MRKIIKGIEIAIITLTLILLGTVLGFNIVTRKHFSERPADPQIASPVEFSANLAQISVENAENLQEISILSHDEDGAIVAIAMDTELDHLLVLSEDGTFNRWSNDASKVIAKHSFFVVTTNENIASISYPVHLINGGVSFNKDGSFAITPNEISPEGLIGYNIWNTDTGMLLYCNGKKEYCPYGDEGFDNTTTGLLFHPTRDLFFKSFGGMVDGSLGYFSTDGNGKTILVRLGDFRSTDVTRIAIDPLGNYLAIADTLGNIRISDISVYESGFPEIQISGYPGSANYSLFSLIEKDITTIDLKFDETHSWLGWLTDECLVIWNLRNPVFPLKIKKQISNGTVIGFDRTGKILVVATQEGFTLIDVENEKIVAEYSVGEVTALYFTRDNRLLIWGDAQGNVHVWGEVQSD